MDQTFRIFDLDIETETNDTGIMVQLPYNLKYWLQFEYDFKQKVTKETKETKEKERERYQGPRKVFIKMEQKTTDEYSLLGVFFVHSCMRILALKKNNIVYGYPIVYSQTGYSQTFCVEIS